MSIIGLVARKHQGLYMA